MHHADIRGVAGVQVMGDAAPAVAATAGSAEMCDSPREHAQQAAAGAAAVVAAAAAASIAAAAAAERTATDNTAVRDCFMRSGFAAVGLQLTGLCASVCAFRPTTVQVQQRLVCHATAGGF
jgi:hypothetical protein